MYTPSPSVPGLYDHRARLETSDLGRAQRTLEILTMAVMPFWLKNKSPARATPVFRTLPPHPQNKGLCVLNRRFLRAKQKYTTEARRMEGSLV